MFYRCKKCKKIWQYPIEKCPDCFLKLERILSKKMKVIGVSKVNIPTFFHQRFPYFVLLLKDENGNKWVQKSIREYKIGEEWTPHQFLGEGQGKEAVAIWRVKYDPLETIEKVVELLGGLELKENYTVLILPTLMTSSHSYFRDNTSPEFLEATLKFLFARGIKPENIKVGAQSFDDIPITAAAQKSGLLNICLENKVLPLDLAKTNFVKKGNFEISEEVFDSNFILNLPILKMGKIQATENILKTLKKENYLGLKYLYSPSGSEGGKEGEPSLTKEIIKNLKEFLPEILTIGEAEVVQKPDKFTIFFGLILASFNTLNLDRVFNEISMIKDLPEILKEVRIESIQILGREVEEVSFRP